MLHFGLHFHHTGDWGPGDVETEWVEGTRLIVPEVEAQIDRAWADALARPGVHLFDGPMCRLERSDVSPPSDGGRLRLSLAATSYRVFLGTNLTHPDLADRYGAGVLANPVGVSPALETSDGYLLLGRRSATVAYHPNRVHPFAGALEPADAGDVFAAVARELREELSIDDADVTDLRCTGLAEDRALRQPELIFRARCVRTKAQLEANLDRVEHRGVWSVPASREAVDSALKDSELTPVAVAALLLWGRTRFGQRWFDAFGATTHDDPSRRGI
jgi:8-oxo-dGTP pyrophosphatase MutT (NUDIX family)